MKQLFSKLDCDARSVFYAAGEEGDDITFIEIRANVTEWGWDTIAFVEASRPGAEERARHMVRCLSTHEELCEALDYLLAQTVDMDLKHGIGLTEGEQDARRKALAAIAKTRCAISLPPDPEGKNDERASWASRAVAAFQEATGADNDDALCDLLADLRHWADRQDYDFEAALERSQSHYEAETSGN